MGDYRRASIVHDVAFVEAAQDEAKHRAADRMFYHAAEMVLAQGEVDDSIEIERRADAALTTVTGLESIQAP